MIKHIVMWRLKDAAHGNTKSANAGLIKEKLEALNGVIPGLVKMEVGIDFANDECSSDVVLYSEFTSLEALNAYQQHPDHKAIKPFILEARNERREVDYAVADFASA